MTADYTYTFTSSSVQLSAAIIAAGGPAVTPAGVKLLLLQPDGGNTNVIYVGGSNHGAAVSSSSYGFRLEAPVSTVPPAPFMIKLSWGQPVAEEYWLKGTDGEKIHIFLKA